MKPTTMVLGLLGLLLIGFLPLFAQTYELRVLNQSVSGSAFEFEIYLLRTGSTSIYLGNCNLVLTFNHTNFSSPVAEVVTEGLSGWYSFDAQVVSTDRYFVSLGQPPFSNQDQFNARVTNISAVYPGSMIGKFRIKNISNFNGTGGLQWRNSGLQKTEVSTLANASPWAATGITDPDFHLNPDDVALPIQLASFTASVIRDNDVEVSWKTVSETNNYGFEIERRRILYPVVSSQPVSLGSTDLSAQWQRLGFVEGHGTTLEPRAYSYVDRGVGFGKYLYRIKQIDLDGKSEIFPEMEVNVGVGPDKFVLAQNYPNPFNPSTVIEFAVPKSGHTTLKVYNILGQEVTTLFGGNAEAGEVYATRLDATRLASGIYFYRLRSAGKVETKRMLLVK